MKDGDDKAQLARELFDSTLDGIYRTNAEGFFVLINNAGAKILGYESPEGIIGRNVLEYWLDPKDRDVLMAELEIKKRVSAYPIRAKKKSGELIDLEATCRRIEDEKGGFLGTEGILRDVTEIREKDKALRASEEKYRTLIDNIPVGIYRHEPGGSFLQANPAMARMFGYGSVEELMNISATELYQTQNEKERFLEKVQKCGRLRHHRLRLRKKDGTFIWCSVTSTVSYNSEGQIQWIDGTIEDITEQKQADEARLTSEEEKEKLQAQLLQAQKMEAVGQLAGGIAHDFNNILTAIISYGSLLKMKTKEDDPLRSYADHVLASAERAANLTQSLLAFSRKQIMNPRPADLNEIIRKTERLLRRIISENIDLRTMLRGGELTVMVDPIQIEQVLMNLATNARDVMPQGGKLAIETDDIQLDELYIKTHGYGKIGKYALMRVSDTGMGMDEETRKRIFEPFFTTKGADKGTGLGLSMVYGIIKQHSGYINAYSERGKGTTFQIYLPLVPTKADEGQPEVMSPIRRGSETILLAEDNEEVRASTRILLEEYGYKIIEAADGVDAVSKFIQHQDEIQLLILDVIMPNKNGWEAYEEIRKIKPAVKAIFTSGYTADIVHQEKILSGGLEFIYKPIAPQALLKKLGEILDKNASH